jgi:response regulator RpfG family c-di-GMP phosphodiesterase
MGDKGLGMSEKVLFVDDNEQLLSAIRRRLRKELDLTTAKGGAEALKCLAQSGPYAVLVTDQNMPQMDGIELLEATRIQSPDTIRIMMTGQADQETTLKAVNDGHVFSILNKPCSPDAVLDAANDAIAYYRVKNAEKLLLEQTLAGSIQLLLDVVSLQNNDLVKIPSYARTWAKCLAENLDGVDEWEMDLAIMLSTIGFITLPMDLTKKIIDGEGLSDNEQSLVQALPATAKDLLSNVPRLDRIAEAIYYQNKGFDGSGFPKDDTAGFDIPIMGRVLKILKDLILHFESESCGQSMQKTFGEIVRNRRLYDTDLLLKCKTLLTENNDSMLKAYQSVTLDVSELAETDLLAEDVRTVFDGLVLTSGQVLTAPMIFKIRQVHNHIGLKTPIKVERVKTLSTL